MTLSEQRQFQRARKVGGTPLYIREAAWRAEHRQPKSPSEVPGGGQAAQILRGQMRRSPKRAANHGR